MPNQVEEESIGVVISKQKAFSHHESVKLGGADCSAAVSIKDEWYWGIKQIKLYHSVMLP